MCIRFQGEQDVLGVNCQTSTTFCSKSGRGELTSEYSVTWVRVRVKVRVGVRVRVPVRVRVRVRVRVGVRVGVRVRVPVRVPVRVRPLVRKQATFKKCHFFANYHMLSDKLHDLQLQIPV